MAELFDYLYNESAIFEGEQAEEYKARKAAAAKEAQKKDDKHSRDRLYRVGASREAEPDVNNNAKRMNKTGEKVMNHFTKTGRDPASSREREKEFGRAMDATDRHLRRQARKGKNESTLFGGAIDLD